MVMKYLKIYEQFDEWDPFGEESEPKELIKKGDVIICTDGSRNNILKDGNEYKVMDTMSEDGYDYIRILNPRSPKSDLENIYLVGYWWDAVRFKKKN